MNRKYKYILNWGLAFDENQAIKRLNKIAKEGWILKELTTFRYRLEKGEPQELIYSMDYKVLRDNKEEYFQLFEDSGWRHMCSQGYCHFFAASPGTVPIYTDRDNYLSKYKKPKGTYLKALIFSVLILLMVAIFSLNIGDNAIANNILELIGMISAGVALPSLMVTIAFMVRTKKGVNIKK